MAQKPKSKQKPKLTDAERHERFIEVAREIGADERPQTFERAFKSVLKPPSPKK